MFLIGAITLGLLGAFHCIGMCGPIAMALPIHTQNQAKRIISILTYNFGRVTTYSVFGLIFGLIGESFSFFGFQQKLSIALGCIILILLLIPSRYNTTNKFASPVLKLLNKVKEKLSAQFRKQGVKSLYITGILNGLLPCGLVYMAAAASINSNHWYNSVLFMIVFGLGTLPFMFSVSYYSNLISLKMRGVAKKLVPVIIATMAILMILRGMNLGIAYISPKLNVQHSAAECNKNAVECCHK